MGRTAVIAVPDIKRSLLIGRGAERFELPETSEARVRRTLIRAAAGDARKEAESVLRLVVALETRLESPTAAERLRAWLRATPELHDAIRSLGFSGAKTLDLGRSFKRREGRSVDLAAPRFGAKAPRGAVPLRALLDQRSRLRNAR